MELINKQVLWEKVAELEEMAMDRYLATPNCLPNGGVNPSAVRYGAQLDERTALKHMIADTPTVDAVPVIRCKDCAKWDWNDGTFKDFDGKEWHICITLCFRTMAYFYCADAERKEK